MMAYVIYYLTVAILILLHRLAVYLLRASERYQLEWEGIEGGWEEYSIYSTRRSAFNEMNHLSNIFHSISFRIRNVKSDQILMEVNNG